MASVPPSTPGPDSPSGPFFICPNCGSAAKSARVRHGGQLVRFADCICPAEHLFIVRWLEAA
jgi:hypothetical protein